MGYKLKRIIIRPNGVEQQIRPTWWQPWANTLAYYPLTSTTTVSDESWNSRDLTNNWILFWTYQGVDCAYNSTAHKYLVSPTLTGTDLKTISLWTYREWTREVNSGYAAGFTYWAGSSSGSLYIRKESSSSFKEYYNGVSFGAALTSQWCNIVIVLWDDVKCYRNWTLIWTGAAETHNNGQFCIFAFINNLSWFDVYYGWISNFIVENKTRTAQEVANYFNQTKSNYWIS